MVHAGLPAEGQLRVGLSKDDKIKNVLSFAARLEFLGIKGGSYLADSSQPAAFSRWGNFLKG